MTNTPSNDRNFFSAADGSVNVETAFTHISGLLMQVFISVHHNVFWKKFTVFSYILEGLFLFFFSLYKCSDLTVLLSFFIKSTNRCLRIKMWGSLCFLFCFLRSLVWVEISVSWRMYPLDHCNLHIWFNLELAVFSVTVIKTNKQKEVDLVRTKREAEN